MHNSNWSDTEKFEEKDCIFNIWFVYYLKLKNCVVWAEFSASNCVFIIFLSLILDAH